MSIQLARALGAQVFATASSRDQDLIARPGATPIDYRAQSVEQYVESLTQGAGFDLVVDTVGGATLDASRWVGVHIRWLRCRFAKRRTQECSPFIRS